MGPVMILFSSQIFVEGTPFSAVPSHYKKNPRNSVLNGESIKSSEINFCSS